MAFDLRVQRFDPKTKRIVEENHYVMKVSQERGTIFIRDGIEYYPNGDRVQKEVAPEVPHVEVEKKKK